jgi:MFS family permease
MNLVIIPSSLFWGSITDRTANRQLLFAFTYMGTAVVFVGMYQSPSIAWLTILAGCLGFVLVANVPAINLLIMETNEKRNWFGAFASAGLISNLGAVCGLLAGLIWSSFIPLQYFFLFCAASSTLSFLLATRLIGPAPMAFEIRNLAFIPWSVLNRVPTTMNLVVRWAVLVPSRLFSPRTLNTAYRTVTVSLQEEIGRMFVSSFLFVFGSSYLGASYVPFLVVSNVSQNVIFGITLANTAAQIITYRYIAGFRRRLGDEKIGFYSILLTCVFFVFIAISAVFIAGTGLVVLNLAVFLGVGWAVALWNSFNSSTVFSLLSPESQGGAVGLFSALNSFGAVLGSFLGGVSSLYAGYGFTFMISAILVGLSLTVRRWFNGSEVRLGRQSARESVPGPD